LNHTHRTPNLSPEHRASAGEASLPRFALPDERSREDAPSAEAWAPEEDSFDSAATSQLPAITGQPSSRRIVRRKPAADATSEVQVEDILLEVYAEEPPPPRRAVESAQASIAMAIASVVPSAPSPSTAYGQVPIAPQPNSWGSIPAVAVHRTDLETTPSLAPMMALSYPPPAPPFVPSARPNRALVVAIGAAVVFVAGVGVVCAGVRDGGYAHLLASAKAATMRASAKPAAPSVAPAAELAPAVLAPPPQAVVAPAAPTRAPVPTISVDALPKSPVPPDMALVTLPAYAHGHRIFVDGRLIAVTDDVPTKIKCGRHTIKIGAARKARAIDLACGTEVILK
jgi:hypothetical protein